jgi:tRNA1Val (adenine37-N6)-methyltransferase
MTSSTKTLFLYQPQNGYCYNSDTHFLYNFFSQSLLKYKNIKGQLLDIGSGSGILGLLLARDFSKLSLHQCELQESFQFLSQKNAEINQIKTTLYKKNFLECKFNTQFEYIVSNPPFYHGDVIKSENENIKIARYNDSLPLDQFIKKVSSILIPKGHFHFCYDSKQLDHIVEELNKNKLNIEAIQFLHPNSKKEASLVMVHARKNSNTPLKILPPIIMFDNANSFTKEVELIYKKCATYSIKCEIL